MKKKVTVVIPNYNGLKFMEPCFQALSRQTSKAFDLLVVDNGSADGSAEWLREHKIPSIFLKAVSYTHLRDSHTYSAVVWDEFVKTINEKPGFVKAMWCGCQECEDKIKEETGATSRCMPFAQETLSDQCICCGKPATKMVYWGRAY